MTKIQTNKQIWMPLFNDKDDVTGKCTHDNDDEADDADDEDV